jgi:hypothetical protein
MNSEVFYDVTLCLLANNYLGFNDVFYLNFHDLSWVTRANGQKIWCIDISKGDWFICGSLFVLSGSSGWWRERKYTHFFRRSPVD